MLFWNLAKDSVIYGGADFLTKALSFLTFPLIAAAFSPMVFGALELITTTTALLGMVINCGLNNAVQRFYWDKDTTREMQPAIVTSGLYAQVAFALTGVALGLMALPFVMPHVERAGWPMTWVALASALIVMALQQWSQFALDVLRLHQAPWKFLVMALLARVGSLAFGLTAVIILKLGVDGLMGAQVLVMLFIVPLALWTIRQDFHPSSFDRKQLFELVRFGYPFIFAGCAFWLLGSMDRWMLASMASVEEVGIFSVAFRIASVVAFISAAFGQAWSPAAMKIRTDHPSEYRNIYGQVLLLLFFIMLAVGGGIALFAGEAISSLLPSEYLPSTLPVVILCFSVIIQSTQQVTAIGISLEKKTYLFVRLSWMTAGVNFLLNLVLIPRFGATGAAWSTLVSNAVLSSGYMYYTQRLHPLEIPWGRMAALSGIGIVLAVVSITFVTTAVDVPILAMKFGLVCACLLVGWRLLPIKSFRQGIA